MISTETFALMIAVAGLVIVIAIAGHGTLQSRRKRGAPE